MEAAESPAARADPLAVTGVSGVLARVRLDDGTTVITKRPAADPAVRARHQALGMYAREARFYLDLAPRLSLRTPRCISASDELLVLEDLAPAEPGTFRDGLTPAQVDRVVDDFAVLHAEWQGSTELARLSWLWRVERDEADRWQRNLESRLPRFVDRHRPMLSDADVATAERFVASAADLMLAAQRLPATLCHGDPGPPNLMVDERDGVSVAYVDWQLVAARHGALDLAWVTVLGVASELRHERERAWLDRYRSITGEAATDLRDALELGALLTLRAPIWMGGATDAERSPHVDAYAAATIPRAFDAVRRLGGLGWP